MDPDPGGPKTCESRSGLGSATLPGVGDGAEELVPLAGPVAGLHELEAGGEAGLGAAHHALAVQVNPPLSAQQVVDAGGDLVPGVRFLLLPNFQGESYFTLRLKFHRLS